MDELVNYEEESLPVELQEDFKSRLQARKQEALTYLLRGEVPKEVVYNRPVRGNTTFDYVPGWWVVDQLNILFGYCWSFEIVKESIGQKELWVLGKLTVQTSNGFQIVKTAYGGSEIDKSQSSGEVISITDDLKSAATNSLKKAASWLGIGLSLYRNSKDDGNRRGDPAASKQVDVVYSIGEKKGLSREEVEEKCQESYQVSVKELDEATRLAFIRQLRSL